MEETEKDLKKQGGKFQKGRSGNPAGKPPGARSRASIVAERLLSGEAEGLARKIIEMGLAGDVACLKVCFERLVPVRKDSPVNLALPPISSATDLPIATEAILRAAAEGSVTPIEARNLAEVLEIHRKSLELAEIEARVAALEKTTGNM